MVPVLYPPHSRYSLELARWAVVASGNAPSGRVDRRELDDAAKWFLTSLEEGFDLPAQHRAVLARWLLDRGDTKDAAKHFLAVLAGGFRLEANNEQYADELKSELYVATARALATTGERTQAEQLLQRCTEEFPRFGGAYRLLADLHAEDTHYEQAFVCLNRWAEANPELESDAPTAIWVKTLRAIGSTRPSDRLRMVDEYFDAHPERLPFVEKAVTVHWSAFCSLDPESRRDWLRGCWMLWLEPARMGMD